MRKVSGRLVQNEQIGVDSGVVEVLSIGQSCAFVLTNPESQQYSWALRRKGMR